MQVDLKELQAVVLPVANPQSPSRWIERHARGPVELPVFAPWLPNRAYHLIFKVRRGLCLDEFPPRAEGGSNGYGDGGLGRKASWLDSRVWV